MNSIGKKALLLDLDNTIYPVSSIGNELFAPLFDLIQRDGRYEGTFESLKDAIMRIPFHKIAARFQFNEALEKQCTDLLRQLSYDGPMKTFEDYEALRSLPADKFLITAGFTKMQQGKVDKLGINRDFKQIYIIDQDKTQQTKKDIFRKIMEDHQYTAEEVLVIGDDAESEIQSARELGIEALLYVHGGDVSAFDMPVISSYEELVPGYY